MPCIQYYAIFETKYLSLAGEPHVIGLRPYVVFIKANNERALSHINSRVSNAMLLAITLNAVDPSVSLSNYYLRAK